MSQSDLTLVNQPRSAFRVALNAALAALATLSSGVAAPTVTQDYQLWVDTSTTPPTLKQRNGANNAWITVGYVGTSAVAALFTGNTERLTVDSSGNVGINDTTPSYTLDVNGDINATGEIRKNGLPLLSNIANNSITLAMLADLAAGAILCNPDPTVTGDAVAFVLPSGRLLGRNAAGQITGITPGTGLTLSGNTLLASASAYSRRQLFIASGTFTVPADANPNTAYKITVVGGGGGAAGSHNGGGSWSNAGPGGQSSFGSLAVANGGGGGTGPTGGAGVGGTVVTSGNAVSGMAESADGQAGNVFSSLSGGKSGGILRNTGTPANGQAGIDYGFGGSGSNGYQYPGGGGGGGAKAVIVTTLTPGQSYTVTVGAGSLGSWASNVYGGNCANGVVIVEWTA